MEMPQWGAKDRKDATGTLHNCQIVIAKVFNRSRSCEGGEHPNAALPFVSDCLYSLFASIWTREPNKQTTSQACGKWKRTKLTSEKGKVLKEVWQGEEWENPSTDAQNKARTDFEKSS